MVYVVAATVCCLKSCPAPNPLRSRSRIKPQSIYGQHCSSMHSDQWWGCWRTDGIFDEPSKYSTFKIFPVNCPISLPKRLYAVRQRFGWLRLHGGIRQKICYLRSFVTIFVAAHVKVAAVAVNVQFCCCDPDLTSLAHRMWALFVPVYVRYLSAFVFLLS